VFGLTRWGTRHMGAASCLIHSECRFVESRQKPTLGISITGDQARWVAILHLRSRESS
jgi:hypothetical protein